ncbi:entericidin A/B family lipoprotein [Guyparkeria hydrothermalis]|nr:entericidin A/B family lipoprotein [Guyparkeria hydrothermalis]MCL7743349.1 entericidin A/B family lipoprotein [Guyparkeria hydrothermalis]
MISRLITATFLAGLLALTAGCNTMEGLGEDIRSLGNSVEDAAKDD